MKKPIRRQIPISEEHLNFMIFMTNIFGTTRLGKEGKSVDFNVVCRS